MGRPGWVCGVRRWQGAATVCGEWTANTVLHRLERAFTQPLALSADHDGVEVIRGPIDAGDILTAADLTLASYAKRRLLDFILLQDGKLESEAHRAAGAIAEFLNVQIRGCAEAAILCRVSVIASTAATPKVSYIAPPRNRPSRAAAGSPSNGDGRQAPIPNETGEGSGASSSAAAVSSAADQAQPGRAPHPRGAD